MQKNKIEILSTRPVGEDLISKAALSDIVIDEISFIETEEIIDNKLNGKIVELFHKNIVAVFTSMNAVNAVARFISFKPEWKIFCIGNTTKKLIMNFFGEEKISATAENADELADKIIKDDLVKNVFFFCGDQRRDELPEKLKQNGIEVNELIVYKTIKTPENLHKNYAGILFFSPTAVESFFSKNTINYNTVFFAIGTTTADAVKHFTSQTVIIAELPGKENLINLAINYFSKSKIL